MVSDRDNPYVPLRLNDISETVGEIIKAERKKILAHVERRVMLAETKISSNREEDLLARIHGLFIRVTALESEFRQLRKKGALPR